MRDGELGVKAIDGLRHRPSGIIRAETHERPAIICATAKQIQFVTALRSMFRDIDLVSIGMHRNPLNVPVPERVDLRFELGLPPERIVARGCAVAFDAHYLSKVRVERLCSAVWFRSVCH